MARALHLLVNRHAGAFTRGMTVESVVDGLEAAGWSPITVTDISDDIEAGIAEACEIPGDAFAIAAGDGTVAAFATALSELDSPPPLLVLPAGTANLLAKRLYGDGDMDSVIATSAGYEPRKIPCGRVDGRIFLIAAAVGITPAFAKARELLREPPHDGRLRAIWRYIRAGVRSLTTRYIGFTIDGETHFRRARAAYVSVGRMGDAHAQGGESRFEPILEVYAGRPFGVVDLSIMLARAAFADFKHQKRAWRATGHHIEAHSKRRLPLIVDGEPGYANSPVVFELIEDALCVMAPKA
ncbi:diacylglycerol/lipid kinase family protein [Hyphobacterium marinum]|uniref:Diacylglycerol kinase family protein n=1 Tax=Hyphobacterium marinum TaxID=3116574 RepID=A0ABU7LVS8_9PROT|nr:diacylglycerol kinase family protein [Hyphobacterium sp. Y6023]MEE2565669.1 diacylglycerol kinase family protein [Hyphobacterium sp. Y6023]